MSIGSVMIRQLHCWVNGRPQGNEKNPPLHYSILQSKPSLKIRTANAICWNYLCLFRDYGLDHVFLRIKLFCFFRIGSRNFQHMFEKEFHETSKNFNSFTSFKQSLFLFFLSVVRSKLKFSLNAQHENLNLELTLPFMLFRLGLN